MVMNEIPMSTQDMRILELNAEYLGVTLGMLMQNAGREVARVITEREPLPNSRVVILCGVGGNGGDGMVAARHLHEAGAKVEVYLVGHEKLITSPDSQVNWSILKNLHEIKIGTLRSESAIKKLKAIPEADIIVDALLGFGLISPVREPFQTAIRAINKSPAIKYAVDIPSGINSDTGKVQGVAIKADTTITMHAPKLGMSAAEDHVGSLIIAAIGIPPEAERICGHGNLWLYNRPRKQGSRKGDFGKILIVGGSNVYSGAPALAGMAALRSGADLVSILAPEPVVQAIRSYNPNLMVHTLNCDVLCEESIQVVLDAAKANDVVALGPGLGTDPATVETVQSIVLSLVAENIPFVIDADGLKAIAGSNMNLNPANSVLTPHLGELQILMDIKLEDASDIDLRIKRSIDAATRYDSVVLLKGATDVIAIGDGTFKLNRTGVPAMTAGGTGDVLTGIVSSFLARGHGAFNAAAAGAFVSGLAGEAAFRDLGNHITATDCLEKIPQVMRL